MKGGRWALWWKAFRFHYSSASFMPAVLGGMIAWTTNEEFHTGYFVLVLLGLVLNHLALNMTDDYYDFRHLVDLPALEEGNPYTGGSGTLSSGEIEPRKMRQVFSIFYGVAIAIGIFLGVMRGPFVFFLLGFGFFCAFFYTAPPIQFGYRGFGELAQLLCFGPGIGLGAYYVQTQELSWEPFWGTLPFGIMLFSMIVINEIPDYLDDQRGGKRNLVVRLGKEKGVALFIASLLSAYGAIVAGLVMGRLPILGAICLLTLPIAWKTISILKKFYEDRTRMASANLGMICTHNLTALLLGLAYCIEGIKGEALAASFLPMVAMTLLYLPVGRLTLGGLVSQRKIHASKALFGT